MTEDNSNHARGGLPLHRRTMLSAASGIALGATLPAGSASAQTLDEYDDVLSSIQLTPRPAATDVGGTQSLNGTWDFTLSPNEEPPSSSARRVTPDLSGTGNDGTLRNDPAVVADSSEQALDLAGDGYVSVAADDTLNFTSTGFTLQATVKYDGGDGLVIDKGSSSVSGGTEQFGLGIYDGTVSFFMQTADGSYPDSLQTDIATDRWHTVTVVVDESDSRLFVDGEGVGSITHGTSGLASSEAPLVVGGDDLDIAVKSTAAFETALSADRISRRLGAVPDSAVLWLDYRSIEDRDVEWRDENVPGQWGYDEYYVPSGPSEWYPPAGELGWYRREFEVPDGWGDGRLALRFDSVYSEAWVYLNGTRIEHHVGGYTPFEIDITDAVNTDGSNTLAVGVAQQSPADDMGWQNVTGGITRDVTLLSVPDVHLSDCDVRTELADDGSTATVDIRADVENAGASAIDAASVTVTLTGPDGETVGSVEQSIASIAAGESRTVSTETSVSDPETWNPEQPRLHTVDVELNADGTTERVSERIGIRDIAVDGNKLRLNGEAVTLRGVNWEEIHLPEYGHAIPPAITREDARRLKEANVNYVRTAHHPTSEAFLDACDELGIVVEMEAPHMFVGRDRGDPYPDVVVEQTLEMVERDKNRASVCLWSVANESEWYDVFDTVGALVTELDPTRPTIFNHDVYDPSDPWHDDYDVRAHHYPALRTDSTVAEHADLSDPILFDEYAHTYCYNDRELVTDPGLRDEWGRPFEIIWEQCRAGDSVAGGAIWAGGDHLEQWGEYLWGLLDRNRRPRPEYWHVKKVYSPVRVTNVEWRGNGNAVRLTIENRHEFVDLAERSVEFDGTPGRGRRSIEVPPGERETVTLPVEDDRLEMTVTHPEGYTIERVVLIPDSPTVDIPSEPAGTTIDEDDGTLSVTTDDLSLHVDQDSGAVEVQSLDDTPLVVDGPELAVTPTQQATGRDYVSAIDHRLSDRTVTEVSLVDDDAAVSITVEYDIAEGTFVLRPLAHGLDVEYEFTLQEAVDAREVGVAVPLARNLTTLSWTRDSQWSVYPDTHVGRPTGTASAFPDGSRPDHEEIRIQSGQPWKDDTTKYGSNDFRGTKRNVYTAELVDGDDHGVCLLADGETHVRAQVRSETVDLLALDRSLSGTNADGWLSRHPVVDEDPTLDAGETVQGSVTLQVVNAT